MSNRSGTTRYGAQRTEGRSPIRTATLLVGVVIYLVLWIYGLVIDKSSGANFVPVDDADNWLHFVLGIGMIGLGVALARRPRTTRLSSAPPQHCHRYGGEPRHPTQRRVHQRRTPIEHRHHASWRKQR